MTTLQLDVPQRMNIVFMLDNLECPGRREVYAVCRLQEQLQLSDEEREAVGYQRIVQPNGQIYQAWQVNSASQAIKDYDVSDDDIQRLCRAIDQFRMVPMRDRMWYEPLIKQLPPPAEIPASRAVVNGAAAAIQ